MTPTDKPKKPAGLLIAVGDGPPPLKSPEEKSGPEEMGEGGTPECARCRYYSEGDMQCKRYPQWVDRMPEDYCGEFVAGAPMGHSDTTPVSDHAQPSDQLQGVMPR